MSNNLELYRRYWGDDRDQGYAILDLVDIDPTDAPLPADQPLTPDELQARWQAFAQQNGIVDIASDAAPF